MLKSILIKSLYLILIIGISIYSYNIVRLNKYFEYNTLFKTHNIKLKVISIGSMKYPHSTVICRFNINNDNFNQFISHENNIFKMNSENEISKELMKYYSKNYYRIGYRGDINEFDYYQKYKWWLNLVNRKPDYIYYGLVNENSLTRNTNQWNGRIIIYYFEELSECYFSIDYWQ